MATALRPVGHEERLTLVGHLEELRTRLIICVVAIVVAFSVCYWQNDRVLEILNKPLETKEQNDSSKSGGDPLEQQARFSRLQKQAYETQARFLESLSAADLELTPGQTRLRAQAVEAARAAAAARAEGHGVEPDHARGHRAVHADDLRRALRRAAPRAAADPLPGVRVPHTGVHAARAQGRGADHVARPGPVPRRAWRSATSSCSNGRSRSCRTSTTTTSTSWSRPGRTTSSSSCSWGRSGSCSRSRSAVLAVTRTGILTTKQLRKDRGYAILGDRRARRRRDPDAGSRSR